MGKKKHTATPKTKGAPRLALCSGGRLAHPLHARAPPLLRASVLSLHLKLRRNTWTRPGPKKLKIAYFQTMNLQLPALQIHIRDCHEDGQHKDNCRSRVVPSYISWPSQRRKKRPRLPQLAHCVSISCKLTSRRV